MAAFRGTLQGNRGQVSRLGSKKSGITAFLNSWRVRVSIGLYPCRIPNSNIEDVSITINGCNGNTPRELNIFIEGVEPTHYFFVNGKQVKLSS